MVPKHFYTVGSIDDEFLESRRKLRSHAERLRQSIERELKRLDKIAKRSRLDGKTKKHYSKRTGEIVAFKDELLVAWQRFPSEEKVSSGDNRTPEDVLAELSKSVVREDSRRRD